MLREKCATIKRELLSIESGGLKNEEDEEEENEMEGEEDENE